jgi:hypothetical protein
MDAVAADAIAGTTASAPSASTSVSPARLAMESLRRLAALNDIRPPGKKQA